MFVVRQAWACRLLCTWGGCGTCGTCGVRRGSAVVWSCGGEWRLRGGPLLVKLVGVEVFGRVMRMVHTWRLRGRGAVVLGRAVARRAVRRALPVRNVSAACASRGRAYGAGRIQLKPERVPLLRLVYVLYSV